MLWLDERRMSGWRLLEKMAAAYANSVIRILNFRTFKTCLVRKGLQRKPSKTKSKLQRSTFAFCKSKKDVERLSNKSYFCICSMSRSCFFAKQFSSNSVAYKDDSNMKRSFLLKTSFGESLNRYTFSAFHLVEA